MGSGAFSIALFLPCVVVPRQPSLVFYHCSIIKYFRSYSPHWSLCMNSFRRRLYLSTPVPFNLRSLYFHNYLLFVSQVTLTGEDARSLLCYHFRVRWSSAGRFPKCYCLCRQQERLNFLTFPSKQSQCEATSTILPKKASASRLCSSLVVLLSLLHSQIYPVISLPRYVSTCFLDHPKLPVYELDEQPLCLKLLSRNMRI